MNLLLKMKNIIDHIIIIDEIRFYLKLFKLYNSYLLLISDQIDMGVGNVTLSSPPLQKELKSISSSYSLFGIDKKLLCTIITERLSNILKAPVLLLLFLKTNKREEEIIKPVINFFNEKLKEFYEEN